METDKEKSVFDFVRIYTKIVKKLTKKMIEIKEGKRYYYDRQILKYL